MRRARLHSLLCSLLAVALLTGAGQYLAHFHVPGPDSVAQNHAEPAAGEVPADDHCALCLQFDRLPAPPAPQSLPAAHFFLIATLEAERLERLALSAPQLWPPARAPPV